MTKLKTSLLPEDISSDLNAMQYVISKTIRDTVNTMLVVKVLAVNNDRIDVETVIQDISSNYEPIGTYTIKDVRYMKWQYGVNCIKAEPSVGDIGIMIISQQDTSGLNNQGESVCQTRGRYNIGDGIYIGGICGLNQTPTQYIDFTSSGMTIKSTQAINVEAPTVNVNATTQIKLGTNATKQIARVGDNVVSGTTVIGQIQANDSIVRSL